MEETIITDDKSENDSDVENLQLLIGIINGIDSNEEIPYRNKIISTCKNNLNWNAEFSDNILVRLCLSVCTSMIILLIYFLCVMNESFIYILGRHGHYALITNTVSFVIHTPNMALRAG